MQRTEIQCRLRYRVCATRSPLRKSSDMFLSSNLSKCRSSTRSCRGQTRPSHQRSLRVAAQRATAACCSNMSTSSTPTRTVRAFVRSSPCRSEAYMSHTINWASFLSCKSLSVQEEVSCEVAATFLTGPACFCRAHLSHRYIQGLPQDWLQPLSVILCHLRHPWHLQLPLATHLGARPASFFEHRQHAQNQAWLRHRDL